jgi:pyruvate/2-oxoglutarate dehydrogenase complex dihydrolipoamide acyltransferase (E2) component
MPYPRLRNFVLDVLAEGRRKNTIHLVLEADITGLKSWLSGTANGNDRSVSLTAFIIHCFANTIDQDRRVQAYRTGKDRLMVFDDVDVSVMVEREWQGDTLPVVHIIRAANKKDPERINGELQAAKTAPLGAEGPMSALEKRFFLLPRPLRKIVWFMIRRDPYWFKELVGTVGVTSMGMFATGAAVVLPITPMTITLSIGSIGCRLALRDGEVVERETILLDLGADHDIVDGAPLMRFAEALRRTLESSRPPLNRTDAVPS